MTADTTLSPRQRLLAQLADDLNVHGWNQKNKIWSVNGEPGDEWLSFLGEFKGAPENYLVDLIAGSKLPEGAHGVVVASEGWDYPRQFKSALADEAALRTAWKQTPPYKHPQRVEIRHLMLACQDGEVIGLTVSHEAEPVTMWARLDASTPSPVGDRTIDAARALLGINDQLARRVNQLEGIQTIANIAAALDKAMSGEASEEEITRDLFLALPDAMKTQVVAEMPDDIKEIVRSVLSEEERRKYGL